MLERSIYHEVDVSLGPGESAVSKDLSIYPRYYFGPDVGAFVVPIQQQFHMTLFPEIAEGPPLPLFPAERFGVEPGGGPRTPGNTIRKVYVCRAPTRQLRPGDVLLFYLSKSERLLRSQSVTSIGVVENVELATSADDLMRRVGRRSVYSRDDLLAMNPSDSSAVLVIDFLLIGHISPPVTLPRLIESRVFSSRPPQAIARIDSEAFRRLQPSLSIVYS